MDADAHEILISQSAQGPDYDWQRKGVEVFLQTRAKRVGGSYHSTHSPLLYNLIGAKPRLEGP